VKITNIRKVQSEPVFDITVLNASHYILENGVVTHNSGLMYSASTIVYLTKSKDKDGTEVIGNIIKCKLQKSRLTKEQSKVDTKLSFTTGLDRYYGLSDLAIEAGIWKSQGGRIELEDGKKVFGKNINQDPSKFFTKDILDRIDEYCGKKYKFGNSLEENDEVEENDEAV
jgi:hypothetical protein